MRTLYNDIVIFSLINTNSNIVDNKNIDSALEFLRKKGYSCKKLAHYHDSSVYYCILLVDHNNDISVLNDLPINDRVVRSYNDRSYKVVNVKNGTVYEKGSIICIDNTEKKKFKNIFSDDKNTWALEVKNV